MTGFCPHCGTKRTGKRCAMCGKSLGHASKLMVMAISSFFVLGYVGVHFVLSGATGAATAAASSDLREEIEAYEKAAIVVGRTRYPGDYTRTATFSDSHVATLGTGRYRIEVPYEGLNSNGDVSTQIATCLVHCDRGLCYVHRVAFF